MSAMLVVTELVETVIARFGTSPSRPARGSACGTADGRQTGWIVCELRGSEHDAR
jgi:hypothetical protein